jgi:phosphopantothenoylcysteine synthetase/decarboxylase
MSRRIIITAGGTVESIDHVRTIETHELSLVGVDRYYHFDISNISKGGFALEIARAFVQRALVDDELELTLIARRDLVKALSRSGDARKFRLVAFSSFNDLQKSIEAEIARGPVDAFLMAAAVSDYSPISVDGKISSTEEELVIRMVKNPKILAALRNRLGSRALLVGFKLLSGSTAEELIAVAQSQARKCHCDLVVANDAQRINWDTGHHPISLVTAESHVWDFAERRELVAERLVQEINMRLDAR